MLMIYFNFYIFREKKRKEERDDLWKRLNELELNHKLSLESHQNMNSNAVTSGRG